MGCTDPAIGVGLGANQGLWLWWLGYGRIHGIGLDISISHPVYREAGQFLTIFQVQLALDVFAMGGNGLHAEMKTVRNLVRGETIADELKYLQFTITQLLDQRGNLAVGNNAAKALDDPILYLLAQIQLAVQHLANRSQENMRLLLLHYITL